jgi:hypothetical protein
MSRQALILLVGVLMGSLLLSGIALAMSSPHYGLDWYTPLTGAGGAARSTNYAVNFTAGQSATGACSGMSSRSCLGYWCGVASEQTICLPLVIRD